MRIVFNTSMPRSGSELMISDSDKLGEIFFFIYETTCLENGKTYRGQHTTTKIDDGYLGSGSLIRAAIKKYGKKSFKRSILKFAKSQDELNELEAVLVPLDYSARDDTYNLRAGGGSHGAHHPETKLKISKANKGKHLGEKNYMFGKTGSANPFFGKRHSSEVRLAVAKNNKRRGCTQITRDKLSVCNKGKTISADQKSAVSMALKGKTRKPETIQKMKETRKVSEKWKSGMSRLNTSKRKSLPPLINTTTNERVDCVMGIQPFCKSNNLNRNEFRKMLRGEVTIYKNWRLA